jgi:hypothetical protein
MTLRPDWSLSTDSSEESPCRSGQSDSASRPPERCVAIQMQQPERAHTQSVSQSYRGLLSSLRPHGKETVSMDMIRQQCVAAIALHFNSLLPCEAGDGAAG